MKRDTMMKRPAACVLSLGPIAPGFFLGFSPKSHKASKFVELTLIARDGKFLR
jgi:hypothetical protein